MDAKPMGEVEFLEACKAGNEEAALEALNAGVQRGVLNTRDEEGNTPLHHASVNRCEDLAQTLLLLGADASAKTKEGLTVLDIAQQGRLCELTDMIELLMTDLRNDPASKVPEREPEQPFQYIVDRCPDPVWEMETSMTGLSEDAKDQLRNIAKGAAGDAQRLNLNGITPAGARALAEALKNGPHIRTLQLGGNQIGDAGARALAEEGLKHVPSLEKLELGGNQIGEAGARALAEEGLKHVPSLQELRLDSNQIGEAGARALAQEGLEHVPSLKTLCLCNNGLTEGGMVRFLKCLQANSPQCFIGVYEDELKDSVPVARAFATLRHLHPGAEVYFTRVLFGHNDHFGSAAQQAYAQQLDLLKLLETGSVPLDTAKVFVCGDCGIGKTTMIKSLPGLNPFNALRIKFLQPADCPDDARERTPGIKVSELKLSTANDGSSKRACFRIYDFGGQPAYHVVHTLLVSDHNAAFVVCVDLSKPENEVKESLWYWLRFLCTRLKQGGEAATATAEDDSGAQGDGAQTNARPQVFIVGTKADQAHGDNSIEGDGKMRWGDACIRHVRDEFRLVMDIYGTFLTLNCHRGNDAVFDKLRGALIKHWRWLKQKRILVPKIVDKVAKALPAAVEQQKRPWNLEVLYRFVGDSIEGLEGFPGFDEAMFHRTLRYLHVRGDVLWFSQVPVLANYVFVSPNWLLNFVMGRVLAPEGVQCGGLRPRNGVITYGDIESTFSQHGLSADLVLEVLQHSHLCFEILPNTNGERQFMLPSRLEEEVDISVAWQQQSGWSFYGGKRLLVEDRTLALPPGLFAHMQTNLYEAFGRTLQLWRNAFKLQTAGVECFGLIRGDREVDVWMRAREISASNANACLDQVFRVAEDLATGIEHVVHVISVKHLRQHHRHPASYDFADLWNKDPTDLVTSTYHPSTDPIMDTVADLLLLNQTPTATALDIPWHAEGFEWIHDQWRLDDAFDQQLQWDGPGQSKVYSAPLPIDSDLYRWIASEVNTGHGVTLSRVEILKSAMKLEDFKFRAQQIVEWLGNPKPENECNNHIWKSMPGKSDMLEQLQQQFANTDTKHLNVLPLWYGCSETVVDNIIAAGTAKLSDSGYFGTGIYLTKQAPYAAAYASKLAVGQWAPPNSNGEHMLLLCAVPVGQVYPITRQEDYESPHAQFSEFYGQRLHPRCDTLYALVTAGSGFLGTGSPGIFHFEEVVVNQEAQVLPFAKVLVKVDRSGLHRYLSSPPTITM